MKKKWRKYLLKTVDKIRLKVSANIDEKEKSELGQFLTPATIAEFMASLFDSNDSETCMLLDAGAGIGTLSSAFLKQISVKNYKINQIEIEAYEIDRKLSENLENVFACFNSITDNNLVIETKVVTEDFIECAVKRIQSGNNKGFTHAILNPPYKKISNNSNHRFLLRQVEIETVNLYSAFVALAIELLQDKGQLVAIIPRSFCNGPYYKPFRNLILEKTAIKQIHLFDSRNKAFRDDEVLQENVIISLERNGKQEEVVVSTSTDDTFSDFEKHSFSFDQIVNRNDSDNFIHIPTSKETNLLETSSIFNHLISDSFVEISTGPVVDFRVKEHIRKMPVSGTVPLLYPGHFTDNKIEFPKTNWKKPNAIKFNESTEKWLYPKGFYTVVRRFSSKEQKRRIYASVVNPAFFPTFNAFGFENHLNVFHCRKRGIPETLAYGLAAFLNSTAVDEYFRRFNGHTQVNATDLRKLKYPDLKTLKALGKWARENKIESQELIDKKIKSLAE